MFSFWDSCRLIKLENNVNVLLIFHTGKIKRPHLTNYTFAPSQPIIIIIDYTLFDFLTPFYFDEYFIY